MTQILDLTDKNLKALIINLLKTLIGNSYNEQGNGNYKRSSKEILEHKIYASQNSIKKQNPKGMNM